MLAAAKSGDKAAYAQGGERAHQRLLQLPPWPTQGCFDARATAPHPPRCARHPLPGGERGGRLRLRFFPPLSPPGRGGAQCDGEPRGKQEAPKRRNERVEIVAIAHSPSPGRCAATLSRRGEGKGKETEASVVLPSPLRGEGASRSEAVRGSRPGVKTPLRRPGGSWSRRW